MRSKDEFPLLLSAEKVKLFSVISNVIEGRISAAYAADALGITRRHVFRLKKRLRVHGATALEHGNRKRLPANSTCLATRKKIFEVFDDWKQKTDLGLNCAHFAEILNEEHDIKISRQTLWRWLRQTGRRMPLRAFKKHRKARLRAASEGQILFLDGSEHLWFGAKFPHVTLILCTDDATSKALYGVFIDFENLAGCFETAFHVFSRHGLPHTFYLDRASQFKTTRKRYEEIEAPPTYWQEAMAAFGVRCIFANSPQARGRGERINGTFQGRLAAELQYKGIHDLARATTYLNTIFIPAYNRKFAKKARGQPLWREKPPVEMLRANLSVREIRKVQNDCTIWFENRRYQILPSAKVFNLAKAEVEIRKCFDGTITIVHRKYGALDYELIKERASWKGRKSPPNPLVTKSLLHTGDIFAVT